MSGASGTKPGLAELKRKAWEVRRDILTMLEAAGSGHSGGSLSEVEMLLSLYYYKLRHDPGNPDWKMRDRFVLSKGHACPGLYTVLAHRGFFPKEELFTFRKLGTRLQGHAYAGVPGVEASTGSLGQGLSIAIGKALAALADGRDSRTYCLMGDGEMDEGQLWEAAMTAGFRHLDGLCGIVDRNHIQQDSFTEEIKDLEPFGQKWAACGWYVIDVDGHDTLALMDALGAAERTAGQPTVLIAHTIKGKGVSFMENRAEWHGKAPKKAELERALAELDAAYEHESKDVFVLAGDLAESTRADLFSREFPERFFNMGIAEQDMLGTAVGLSLSGKVPFVCSFTVFICGRGYDQIRISVCYNNQNVKIVGSHSGLTVGPDGATAQALEDIAMMRVLPNMTALVPADAIEARKATVAAASVPGPVFLRLGREPLPNISTEGDPFEMGEILVLKPGRDITLIACGIMVTEALRAAEVLAGDGVDAGVINVHTIKPLDEAGLVKAVQATGAVVTAEEHQIHGGLGSAVAEVVSRHCPCYIDMVAVQDVFGESGEPGELLSRYGLTHQNIREKALRVLKKTGTHP